MALETIPRNRPLLLKNSISDDFSDEYDEDQSSDSEDESDDHASQVLTDIVTLRKKTKRLEKKGQEMIDVFRMRHAKGDERLQSEMTEIKKQNIQILEYLGLLIPKPQTQRDLQEVEREESLLLKRMRNKATRVDEEEGIEERLARLRGEYQRLLVQLGKEKAASIDSSSRSSVRTERKGTQPVYEQKRRPTHINDNIKHVAIQNFTPREQEKQRNSRYAVEQKQGVAEKTRIYRSNSLRVINTKGAEAAQYENILQGDRKARQRQQQIKDDRKLAMELKQEDKLPRKLSFEENEHRRMRSVQKVNLRSGEDWKLLEQERTERKLREEDDVERRRASILLWYAETEPKLAEERKRKLEKGGRSRAQSVQGTEFHINNEQKLVKYQQELEQNHEKKLRTEEQQKVAELAEAKKYHEQISLQAKRNTEQKLEEDRRRQLQLLQETERLAKENQKFVEHQEKLREDEEKRLRKEEEQKLAEEHKRKLEEDGRRHVQLLQQTKLRTDKEQNITELQRKSVTVHQRSDVGITTLRETGKLTK